MKNIIFFVFLSVPNLAFCQIYRLSTKSRDSTFYTRTFDKIYYHQDSVQFVFLPNGKVDQYIWENNQRKKTLSGSYFYRHDTVIIKNKYTKSRGLKITVIQGIYNNSQGSYIRLYDLNNNRLTNYFLEFQNRLSFLGFETDILCDSVNTESMVRICADNGAICSKWFTLKCVSKVKLIANIDFAAPDYQWDIKRIILKKINGSEMSIISTDYDN